MNVKKEYYVEDKKTLRNENISLLTEDKKYNNCDYSSDSHISFQKSNTYGSIHPTNKFRNLNLLVLLPPNAQQAHPAVSTLQ